MTLPETTDAYSDGGSQEDGERVVRRGWRLDDNGKRAILIVLPAADRPSRSSLDHLTHEYELRDELDGAWAVRPLDLVRDAGRTMLVLEDAGGQRRTGLAARYFSSPCRRRKRTHESSAVGSPGVRAARRHFTRCCSSTGLRR